MSKKTKIWLILAAIFVISGAVIFCIAMSINNWDFTKLSTVKYETNIYEIKDQFNDISINASVTDIEFVPSEDNSCKVICNEMEKVKHNVLVVDNKLTITVNDERKWFDYINIVNIAPKVTVCLPNESLDSLNFEGATGNIKIKNVSIETMNLKIATGDIELNNIQCDSFSSEGSTGDVYINDMIVTNVMSIKLITGDIEMNKVSCNKLDINIGTGETELTNVLVTNDFTLEGNTGDVLLESFDALNIYITITTGDVDGTILTDKIFNAQSVTGDVNVPETYSGGVCKIRTNTGDIDIFYKK